MRADCYVVFTPTGWPFTSPGQARLRSRLHNKLPGVRVRVTRYGIRLYTTTQYGTKPHRTASNGMERHYSADETSQKGMGRHEKTDRTA